jgi:hypothetical protein
LITGLQFSSERAERERERERREGRGKGERRESQGALSLLQRAYVLMVPVLQIILRYDLKSDLAL